MEQKISVVYNGKQFYVKRKQKVFKKIDTIPTNKIRQYNAARREYLKKLEKEILKAYLKK